MTRRTVISDVAEDEIRAAKRDYASRSPRRASEFLSEVRVGVRAIEEFPFSKAVQITVLDMEIRRIKVPHFPFFLFYFVYPSFDPTTAQAIDVVYVLACRHERQGEPLWEPRDPFRI